MSSTGAAWAGKPSRIFSRPDRLNINNRPPVASQRKQRASGVFLFAAAHADLHRGKFRLEPTRLRHPCIEYGHLLSAMLKNAARDAACHQMPSGITTHRDTRSRWEVCSSFSTRNNMAIINCLVIRRAAESDVMLQLRVSMALEAVARLHPEVHVVACTANAKGLSAESAWGNLVEAAPGDICYIASFDGPMAMAKQLLAYDMESSLRAVRNPDASKLWLRYRDKGGTLASRDGRPCEVLDIITRPSGEAGYETLPRLRVRFDDGRIESVAPDDTEADSLACLKAKRDLLNAVADHMESLLEAA